MILKMLSRWLIVKAELGVTTVFAITRHVSFFAEKRRHCEEKQGLFC